MAACRLVLRTLPALRSLVYRSLQLPMHESPIRMVKDTRFTGLRDLLSVD